MARTIVSIRTNASIESVLHYLNNEFMLLGFEDKSTPNERIWGKNDGIMIKGQRIAVFFQPGEVVLSAWLHDAMLGDSDLNGIVAAPMKKKLKKILDQLAAGISSLPAERESCTVPQISADIIYCSACGNRCSAENTFCSKCGNRLRK